MAFDRMMGCGRCIGSVVAVAAFSATAGFAATPLDFPSPLEIESGHTYAWRSGSSFLMDDPTTGPFTFTYAIGSSFMANQQDLSSSEASEIVEHALESWTVASRGHFTFTRAPWSAVMNAGDAPPDQWEGPSVEEWLSGDFPGLYPGWGANFEFFSVPTGFTLNSQGVQYVMKPTSLAFTVVNRIGSTHITSVDVYFNSSFDWFDAHQDDSSAGGAFESPMYDLATVLLHELGHALGLDHPNESLSNGSANLSPYTFDSGYPWSTQEIMYGFYQGVRDHPTIDEVGGVAFLYGLPSPLDLNGDHEVSGADLAMMLANWGGSEMGLPGDLNYDGSVDAADLGILLSNFDAQIGPVDDGAAASSAWPDQPDVASAEPLHPIVRDCYHVPLNGAGTPE